MTITQTVEIPADRRLTLEVPGEVPVGRVILSYTTSPEADSLHQCPVCAGNIDPETGNPRYGPRTVAAIEEGMAISSGEIPAKRFRSLTGMLENLERDGPDG